MTLTEAMTINAQTTTTGAKLTSFRSMVVVQQKSRGSLYCSGGPKGSRTGGREVALIYGLGTTQRSDDHMITWRAIVLSGRYITIRKNVTKIIPRPPGTLGGWNPSCTWMRLASLVTWSMYKRRAKVMNINATK